MKFRLDETRPVLKTGRWRSLAAGLDHG